MSAHHEAMSAYRKSIGCVDRGAVEILHDSGADDFGARRCTSCTGLEAGRCRRPRAAGFVATPPAFELGVMKTMHQNCPAYELRADKRGGA